MAKKKFAIRSFFTGRASKPATDGGAAEYASDSDDLNDAHPFDPNQVNRPPKLDDRTEADLRRACAIIVENLKPSGYDLEDTRMQSDILVDNPDVDHTNAFPPRPKPTGPQPDATWYLDASTRSSQFVNPRSVVKSPDKRASTYRISGIASDYEPPSHTQPIYKPLDAQDLPTAHRAIDHTESPRAPLASGTVTSRNLASPLPKQVNHVKSVPDPANPSSSSVLSENGPASTSTTATSTTYTPSTNSKRTSDNAKPDPSSASASSGPGPWMKQEVDRRINAERYSRSAISTRDSNFSSDDAATPHLQSVGEAQAISIRAGQMISPGREQVKLTDIKAPNSQASLLTQPAPRDNASEQPGITSGTLSGPFEQPQLVDEISEHDTGSNSLQALTPLENDRVQSPISQDSSQLAQDYQKSIMPEEKPAGSAVVQDGSASPSKAKSSSTNSRPTSTVANRPASSSSQKSDGSKRGSKILSPTSPLSPGLPKSPQNWPAPPKPRYSEDGIPQIPPIPDKHQLDESIVVKDFYKPYGGTRMKMYRHPANPAHHQAQPGDVEAADFDSFMSVVKDSSKPNTPAGNKADPLSTTAPATSTREPESKPASTKPPDSKSESSTPAAVSRPISSREPPQLQKDSEPQSIQESFLKGPSNAAAAQEPAQSTSPSRPQSQRSPAQEAKPLSSPLPSIPREVEVKDPPRDQQPQPFSPVAAAQHHQEVASPAIVSSSRTSISTPLPASSHSRSASISKRNRGLKRFLSKLGNNDRNAAPINGQASSRRRYIQGFAPGAYVPGHGMNGGIEENEEWFDEQACAAPVVGFGRGW